MQTIDESSTSYLTVTPKDRAGAAAVPTTLSYAVRCLTTGTVMRADTSVTPAAPAEITLTPSDNAINDPLNAYEIRRITIKAGYGSGDAVNAEFDYRVRNLQGV